MATAHRIPKLLAAFVLIFAQTAALSPVSLAADPGAPPTAVRPAIDTLQGVVVSDPYRWLEDAADPAVRAWSDAQNARARSYLDGLPVRSAIRGELESLTSTTSPAWYNLKRAGDTIFAMLSQPPRQQPMLVAMPSSADPAQAKIIVDPNAIDAKGATAIDWFAPSNDGRYVAASLSQGGSEDGILHVIEVASGKEVGAPIADVQYPTAGGSVTWATDSTGFWYTRYPMDGPAEDRHFYQRVYFHALGTQVSDDALVLGPEIPNPRIAEILLDSSFDSTHHTAIIENGDSGDYRLFTMETGRFIPIGGAGDRIIAAAYGPDRALYIVSRKDGPHGEILKLAAGDLDIGHARVIVPEDDGTIAPVGEEGNLPFLITSDRLYVKKLVGGPSRVDIYDLDGRKLGVVPLPDVASVDELIQGEGDGVLFSVATYLRPTYFARFDPGSGKVAETGLAQTSPVRFDDAELVREFALSKDGTRIPVNIIRRKGTKLDGSNPALLYGYGGYGISLTPQFLGAERRVWLDGGGIYAIANIRGGGEYGEAWHREGALTRKQNVFDDFFAAAQRLTALGYTTPNRLAIRGGSNGGLLMGAELTQHPDAFRAVVAQVGIYDMLRVELDPNGAFNTTEFGSVKDPDQFRALYAYSPYHHVVDGTAYPSVLFTTGANDGRVNPMQSRKMTARLQAATSSGRPIYLATSANSGHGHGSALSVRIDQGADYLAFLFDQLGMTLPAPPLSH
jgi:prolyl oligopeptidase